MSKVARLLAIGAFCLSCARAQMQMPQQNQVINVVFDWPENYSYANMRLLGCRKDSNSLEVKCDFSFQISKDTDENPVIFLEDFKLISPDGSASSSSNFTLNGKTYSDDTRITLYPKIDYKLTANWKLNGSSYNYIKYLDVGYKGHDAKWARFENVPLNPPPSAVAPVVTPAANAVQYNIQLSGCKATGNGAYTCAGAAVTPGH